MNSAASNNRNINLDVLKTLAAFSVVCIHYNHVSGNIGEIYSRIIFNITKFAVPFFFLITGYYLRPLTDKQKNKAYLRKILIMALSSTAFYFTFYIIDAKDSLEWLKSHYTLGSTFTWLTGQNDPAGFHLWYLYCLIWSFMITSVILKYLGSGWLYVFAVFTVIYHYTDVDWFRCYGLSVPSMAIGVYLYENNNRIQRLSPKLLSLLTVAMLLFMACEAYYEWSEPGYHYEGHILAVLLLILAICYPSGHDKLWLAKIGAEYSALVYILHVFASNILSRFISYETVTLQVARPFIVFATSLLMAMLVMFIYRLKKKWNT